MFLVFIVTSILTRVLQRSITIFFKYRKNKEYKEYIKCFESNSNVRPNAIKSDGQAILAILGSSG
jgi:hypothetical protein